jgi:hypothetical protein
MYLVWMSGDECVRSERVGNVTPTYEAMRAGLEATYPGRRIFSPLEQAKGKFVIVACYLSKSRDGVGRCGSQFYEWAVEAAESQIA